MNSPINIVLKDVLTVYSNNYCFINTISCHIPGEILTCWKPQTGKFFVLWRLLLDQLAAPIVDNLLVTVTDCWWEAPTTRVVNSNSEFVIGYS